MGQNDNIDVTGFEQTPLSHLATKLHLVNPDSVWPTLLTHTSSAYSGGTASTATYVGGAAMTPPDSGYHLLAPHLDFSRLTHYTVNGRDIVSTPPTASTARASAFIPKPPQPHLIVSPAERCDTVLVVGLVGYLVVRSVSRVRIRRSGTRGGRAEGDEPAARA